MQTFSPDRLQSVVSGPDPALERDRQVREATTPATPATKRHESNNLFDLEQDIVGGLPMRFIGQWLATTQQPNDALVLLHPHQVRGYTVCSDTSGFTKLTQQMRLLEMLAIIHQSKEIIHQIGSAVGGRGIGIWAADNTQMLYPQNFRATLLLSALLTIQDRINQHSPIQIGLGAHFGDFYELCSGLYGPEADAIESYTEDEVAGGEIVISGAIVAQLPKYHGFRIVPRAAEPTALGSLFNLVDGPRLDSRSWVGDSRYPIPYSEAFYQDLTIYSQHWSDRRLQAILEKRYLQHKVVVLVEREGHEAACQATSLCRNLLLSAVLKESGLRLLQDEPGSEIKVAGPLGIYVFDEPQTAVSFAEGLRHELAGVGVRCRIGIDSGDVVLFELLAGGKDIAGMPVNVASKMAQDQGQFGKIYLSSSVAAEVDTTTFTTFCCKISGLELTTYEG